MIHIVHWIWNLSLGGDAKNLCALVRAQRQWAEVSVLTRSRDPGLRANELMASGIQVIPNIDSAAAVSSLAKDEPSIAILHRNGRHDDVESQVLSQFVQEGIPCIEFNTFGRVDTSTDRLWSGHLFPSRTCLMQYAQRRNCGPLKLPCHAAPGYAVEIPALITDEERAQAREALRIPSDCFALVRVQRPDLRKWDPMPVLAVQRTRARGVILVVQSAPPKRYQWLRHKLGDAVVLLEPTSDAAELRRTLAAADCFVNCSHIGETFGLAMAEGMACGLPPIVNSTPEMDNAQVELVAHRRTGLVANSVSEMVVAIEALYENRSLASELGRAAAAYIANTFAAAVVERRCRRFIRQFLSAQHSELRELIPQPPDDCDDYRLDAGWLTDTEVRALSSMDSNISAQRQLLDDFHLQCLRTLDNFDYVLSLSPAALMALIMQRLARGSVHRD